MRARYIASNIIDSSKLSEDEKNIVKTAIKKATTEEAVRAHLSAHNLKSNFNIYGKNVDFYIGLVKSSIRTRLVKRIAQETGENEEVVKQRMKEEKLPYIEEALG
jgi:hypothetical protein